MTKKHWLFVIPIFLIFLFQCLYFAWHTGRTTDETYFNASGYSMVRYNNYTMIGEHPPLMMQLGALPLLFLQPKFPIDNPVLLPDTNNVDLSKTIFYTYWFYDIAFGICLVKEKNPQMIDYIYLGGVLAFYSTHLYHVFGRK